MPGRIQEWDHTVRAGEQGHGASGASGAAKADDWAADLHALWCAAVEVLDVTALADRLYRVLRDQPGVVTVVGARWNGDRIRYVRYLSAGDAAPSIADPTDRESTDPAPGPAPGASGGGTPNGRPVLRAYDPARDTTADPRTLGVLRAAGAATALECGFALDTGDRATLTVGLSPGVDADATLPARLVQVCEVLVASNRRILEEHRHERRQVSDAFLAEASLQMDSNLDVQETLGRVARLAVPALAEGCMIHLSGPGDRLVPSASAHVAAVEQAWIADTARHDPWLADLLGVVRRRRDGVVLGGQELAGGPFGVGARGAGRSVGAVSVSPLRARGRVLGTITFLYRRDDGTVDVRLLDDLADRAALAIDTSTLYEQRRSHVQSLQRHLLPQALPEVDGLRLSASYEVSDGMLDVGGDFYDAVVTADGVALIIGDVCGRGAEAAALTGLARHTLRTLLEDGADPGSALSRLNRSLIREGTSRFVTAAVAVLRRGPAGYVASVAGAGHPYPLVRRSNGTVEEVHVAGMLLGVTPSVTYAAVDVALGPGDGLVLFTDGLTEARNAEGAFFEGFLADAVARSGEGDPGASAARLTAEAKRFRTSGADDTAVLTARVEEGA
ncbi:PP2C family protein-serine/threonine phosphatase [Streptomyces sp. NPDC002602]|uniref:PP2C family protein-serine/threonine phosphatase n=1 Tax=Streptomyces sp. NPDC002602 TaxID=3364654 RepID=UPI00368E96C6